MPETDVADDDVVGGDVGGIVGEADALPGGGLTGNGDVGLAQNEP